VGVPPALDRVVRRCLEKKPEQRFQSASDLAFALRAISDTSDAPALEKAPDKRKASRMALTGGLAIVIVATLVSWWYFRNWRVEQANESEQHGSMHIARVTGSGQVQIGAISPDGKYIVYVLADAKGNQSLVLRHVATGQEVTIVVPTRTTITGLTFSKDSNYVYYVSAPEAGSAGVLYRVTVLGGNPQELLRGIYGAIALSPDDRRMAYLRDDPDNTTTHLLIANKDGSDEHAILSRRRLELTMFTTNGELAWSPDGRKLAMVVFVPGRGHADLMMISPGGGSPEPICSGWIHIESIAWRNGSELILNGSRNGIVGATQLWTVSYPGCRVRKITNDTNSYAAVSIAADSNSILTVQQTILGTIGIVEPQGTFRQISASPSAEDGVAGLDWMKDGSLVYTFKIFDNWNLGLMNMAGHRNVQLTTDSHNYFHPYVAPDGQTLVFSSDRGGLPQAVWRMNRNGGLAKRLSASFGIHPIVSDDGKWVLYFGRKDGDYGLQRVPFEGGPAQFVGERQNGYPIGDSSDGKLVASLESNDTDSTWRIVMIPIDGGPPVKVSSWIHFTHPSVNVKYALPRLSPDRKQIVYVGYQDGIGNLRTQDFDGRKVRQLSHFTDPADIFDFAIASDGRIAVSRGVNTSDIVLINRPPQ
jgi:Tol biopolymer transport system component